MIAIRIDLHFAHEGDMSEYLDQLTCELAKGLQRTIRLRNPGLKDDAFCAVVQGGLGGDWSVAGGDGSDEQRKIQAARGEYSPYDEHHGLRAEADYDGGSRYVKICVDMEKSQ